MWQHSHGLGARFSLPRISWYKVEIISWNCFIIYVFIALSLCVCVCILIPQYTWRSDKICISQFSLSIIQVLGIRIMATDLAATTLIQIHLAGSWTFFITEKKNVINQSMCSETLVETSGRPSYCTTEKFLSEVSLALWWCSYFWVGGTLWSVKLIHFIKF